MKIFHKILVITMAFLVLFSSSAFAINMHYCGKTLVDYSLTKAKTCGMKMSKPAENPSSGCEIQKKSCCSDKDLLKQQENLKVSPNLNFEVQDFNFIFTYTYIQLFEVKKTQHIPHQNYSPPLLVYDLLVLDETFLI